MAGEPTDAEIWDELFDREWHPCDDDDCPACESDEEGPSDVGADEEIEY